MEFNWQKEAPTAQIDLILDFRLKLHHVLSPQTSETAWWSVLIGLQETSIDAFLEATGAHFRQDILIPDDYSIDDRNKVEEVQYIACFARASFLNALNTGELGDNVYSQVSSLTLGTISNQDYLALEAEPQVTRAPDIKVPKNTVLTAVIDDGIGFAHNFFRKDLTKTRVAFANILSASTKGGGVSVGRVLNEKQINHLLERNTYAGLLDEDRFYDEAGLRLSSDGTLSTVALRRSHGTHVMGLAAGYEMSASPDDRPILCALLPAQVTADSTGQNLAPMLALAFKRLTRQASRFVLPNGKRPPVVFSFSYGNFSGPHDGTSPVEEEFARYFSCEKDQVRRLVLPVGNGNLSQTHGQITFDKSPRELDLLLHPEDRTPSFIEMWMPYAGQAPLPPLVEVVVVAPNGAESKPVRVSGKTDQVLYNSEGQEVARLAYRFVKRPTKRGVIILATAPTASHTSSKVAPSGQWKIKFKPLKIKKKDSVEVWIARDEAIPGFGTGSRQSYFNNADYVRFDAYGAPLAVDPPASDSPVKRAGTQSGIATGAEPLVVAGFAQSNRLLVDYSAAGPVTPKRGDKHADRCGPDAAAKTDDSPILRGVLSAGTHSGSVVRMDGTSVAAPRVARLVVSAVANGKKGDRCWLWQKAKDTPYQPIGGDVPNKTRTGGGQVNIKVPFDPI